MSKASKVNTLLDESTMFTGQLKGLMSQQSEIGKHYRELDTSLSAMIDALQEPVGDENKKSIIRKADDLRNKIHNLNAMLSHIDLDFVLKLR